MIAPLRFSAPSHNPTTENESENEKTDESDQLGFSPHNPPTRTRTHHASCPDLTSRGPSILGSLNEATESAESAESASTERRALFDRSLISFVFEGPSTMSIGVVAACSGPHCLQRFLPPRSASRTTPWYGGCLLLCSAEGFSPPLGHRTDAHRKVSTALESLPTYARQ